MLQTEHDFTLPLGYLDGEGTLHREGVMRLATAADEILPLKDPRVQKNPAYLAVILLSRVVTRLGAVDPVTPNVLRVLLGNDTDRQNTERILVLECEIDDMNPQLFGLVMERLYAAGALEVYFVAHRDASESVQRAGRTRENAPRDEGSQAIAATLIEVQSGQIVVGRGDDHPG